MAVLGRKKLWVLAGNCLSTISQLVPWQANDPLESQYFLFLIGVSLNAIMH